MLIDATGTRLKYTVQGRGAEVYLEALNARTNISPLKMHFVRDHDAKHISILFCFVLWYCETVTDFWF